MTIKVVTNEQEFKRQLNALKREMAVIAQAATRAGAVNTAKAVRRFAPKDTGRLRRAVVVKRMRRVPKGEVGNIVGIRQGRGAVRVSRRKGKLKVSDLDAFYWRFLEDGFYPAKGGKAFTAGRRRRELERKRRAARGDKLIRIPFLARAFEATSQSSLRAIERRFDQELAKRSRNDGR